MKKKRKKNIERKVNGISGVSIVMPIFKADKNIMVKIDEALEKQTYKKKHRNKIEIIKVDKGKGLAEQINYGIKKAKYDIIVSLHQDAMPSSAEWLENLVKPLENPNVVASVSKVELPLELWKNFSLLARIISAKEQKVLKPLLDEKGCAYKKSALVKAGMFNSKDFRTAGEDFDMWLKLKEIGKIAYPNIKIMHLHKHTFKNRIKKELQLSNGFGALVKTYGRKMPKYWLGTLKAVPFFGWPIFLFNFELRKISWLFIIPWLALIINLIYSYGFWKGFLQKKQTI